MPLPLLAAALPSLITVGGGLLGGLLGGKQEKNQSDRDLRQQKDLMKYRRDMAAGDFKPTSPRYESYGNMGIFDDAIKRLAIGMMGDKFGDKLSGFGIDPSSLLEKLGQPSKYGDNTRTTVGRPGGTGGTDGTGGGGYGGRRYKGNYSEEDESGGSRYPHAI